MTYEELCRHLEDAKAENENRFGSFGIDYEIERNGNVITDIWISWPPLETCFLTETHKFAQALEAACFEGAFLVGEEITG